MFIFTLNYSVKDNNIEMVKLTSKCRGLSAQDAVLLLTRTRLGFEDPKSKTAGKMEQEPQPTQDTQ